jgi:hypothetical protein
MKQREGAAGERSAEHAATLLRGSGAATDAAGAATSPAGFAARLAAAAAKGLRRSGTTSRHHVKVSHLPTLSCDGVVFSLEILLLPGNKEATGSLFR